MRAAIPSTAVAGSASATVATAALYGTDTTTLGARPQDAAATDKHTRTGAATSLSSRRMKSEAERPSSRRANR